MLLRIPLTVKQSEFERSLKTVDVTGYGGGKGSGKSYSARTVPLKMALETPGLVTGLFRKSYPELEDNHIGPLFRQFPGLRDFYNSAQKELRIPSLESSLKFRYCQNLADVDKQAGREYHKLIIEESCQWQYEMAIRLIRNSNRSSVPGIKASAGLCFNWGDIGHGWHKRVFWDRNLRPNERDLTWNFIHAKIEDNPALLENDPGYLARLNAEPNEALRRAHRHGDPNVVAGQYFDVSSDLHFIPSFSIPPHWKRFGAYDYGYNHPAAWVACAVDEDGNYYVTDEYIEPKQSLETQAARVKKMRPEIRVWPAGHDCWAKKSGNDPTIAEKFQSLGITLHHANIDRLQRAALMRQLLSWKEEPSDNAGERGIVRTEPRLRIFKNCERTWDCLTRMVHDPNRVEDVLKVDATESDPYSGDDAYDALGYALTSRPGITLPLKKKHSDMYSKQKRTGVSGWTA